jgi:hypothetical protein
MTDELQWQWMNDNQMHTYYLFWLRQAEGCIFTPNISGKLNSFDVSVLYFPFVLHRFCQI